MSLSCHNITQGYTMEGIRDFLDTSSINGLNHISTTRGLSRSFWIFVVFSGFLVSGFLIHQSFQTWDQQPIVTTIETLPAEEMKLPKVTVCPPKNSFTDLNYDLMLARNVSFTYEMFEELSNYAEYAIDIGYLKYLSKLEDKDHFYNWYQGISPIELPTLYKDKDIAPYSRIDYTLTSYALSGNITTKNFGDKFSLDLLERNVEYQIKIEIPEAFQNNEYITIDMKLEWLRTEKGRIRMSKDFIGLYSLQDFKEYSFTTKEISQNKIYITYTHKIETGEDIKMDLIPGFKLGWSYTGKGIELIKSPKPVTFGSGKLTNSFKRGV